MGVGMKLRKDSPADDGGPEGPSPVAVRPDVVGGRTQLGELLVARPARDARPAGQALMQQVTSGKRIGTTFWSSSEPSTSATWPRPCRRSSTSPSSTCSQQTPTPEAIELMPESVSRSHLAVPSWSDDERAHRGGLGPQSRAGQDPGQRLRPGRPPRHRTPIGHPARHRHRLPGSRQHPGARPCLRGDDRQPSPATADTGVQVAMADDAPVVQVVNLLITQAMRDRASDIHIEPQGQRSAHPVPHRRSPARRRRTFRRRWRPRS